MRLHAGSFFALLLPGLALSLGCADFALSGAPPQPSAPKPAGLSLEPRAAFGRQQLTITGSGLDAGKGEQPEVLVHGVLARALRFEASPDAGPQQVVVEVPEGLPRGTGEVRVRTSAGEAALPGFEYLGTGHLEGEGEAGRATVASLPGQLLAGARDVVVVDHALSRVFAARWDGDLQQYLNPDASGAAVPDAIAWRDDQRVLAVAYHVGAASRLAFYTECPKVAVGVGYEWRLVSRSAPIPGRILALAHHPGSKRFVVVRGERSPTPAADGADRWREVKLTAFRHGPASPATPPDGVSPGDALCGSALPNPLDYREDATPAPLAEGTLFSLAVLQGAGGQADLLAASSSLAEEVKGAGGTQTAVSSSVTLFAVDTSAKLTQLWAGAYSGAAARYVTRLALGWGADGAVRLAQLDALGALRVLRVAPGGPETASPLPAKAWALLSHGGALFAASQAGVDVFALDDGAFRGRIDTEGPVYDVAAMPGTERFLIATAIDERTGAGELRTLDGQGFAEEDLLGLPFDVTALAVDDLSGTALAASNLLQGYLVFAPEARQAALTRSFDEDCYLLTAMALNRGAAARACIQLSQVGATWRIDQSVRVAELGTQELLLEVEDENLGRDDLAAKMIWALVPYQDGFAAVTAKAFHLAGTAKCPRWTEPGCSVAFPDGASLPPMPGEDSLAASVATNQATGSLIVPQRAAGQGGEGLAALEVLPGGAAGRRYLAPGDQLPVGLSASWDGEVVAAVVRPALGDSKRRDLLVWKGAQRVSDGLWSTLAGAQLAGQLSSVAVAPDGSAVYAGTQSGSLVVVEPGRSGWQAPRIRYLALLGAEPITSLSLSAEGTSLVAALATSPYTFVQVR